MIEEKKVIVFTMAYNAEKTLPRTIESIINQTHRNLEYYILNNASEDDTGKVIQEYIKKDERVKSTVLVKNDPTNGGALFNLIANVTNADYMVWCDADDTYSLDYIEKMVRFAEENNLDMAACGYDCIDGITGQVVKHRVLEENLVLHDELFVDEFIKYRGFTIFLWGKLYSVPFLRRRANLVTTEEYELCADSSAMLKIFLNAKRVGIYAEAMYQYYQYPRSLSKIRLEEGFDSYNNFWTDTKRYIESYGEISKLNEDFLYAIYLSLMEEGFANLKTSNMDDEQKAYLLIKMLSTSICEDTFKRDADAQFKNLACRNEFLYRFEQYVNSLDIAKNQLDELMSKINELREMYNAI